MADAIGIVVRPKSGGPWVFHAGTPEYAVVGLGPLTELEILTVTDIYQLLTLTPVPENIPAIWTTATRSNLTVPSTLDVPSGQNVVWIPITATHTNTHSMIAYISGLSNVTGGTINVGSSANQLNYYTPRTYRWSIGDDLIHWVRLQFPNASYSDGNSVRVNFTFRGSTGASGSCTITFRNGATHPTMPTQFHRPMKRLNLTGAVRNNTFNPATIDPTETGYLNNASTGTAATGTWRGRPAHGHSQDGNGETGVYLNNYMPGHLNPFSYSSTEQALRLHTEAFPDNAPYSYNGRTYKHQAVMMNGQRLDSVCGNAGVWRMVAKTPRRRYTWPAFWLIGRSLEGATSPWGQWPPEIDIMEQFNQIYNNDTITGYTTHCGQHYGNFGSSVRVGAHGTHIEANLVTGATTGWDQDYHSYACAVIWDDVDTRRSKVVYFYDDIEIYESILYARHQDMQTRRQYFPMANVAVRSSSTYTADQYNTDEGRGNHGDMFIRDIGYYPSGFTLTDIPEGTLP